MDGGLNNVTYDDELLIPRGIDLISIVRDECQALIDSYRPASDGINFVSNRFLRPPGGLMDSST